MFAKQSVNTMLGKVIATTMSVNHESRRIFARALSNGSWNGGQEPSMARTLNTTAGLDVKADMHVPEASTGKSTSSAPKVPPSPALPRGIAGLFMGHAAALLEKKPDDDPRVTPLHKLSEKRIDWYKETNSKTIMVDLMGTKTIYCSDPVVYREILGEKQASFTNSNALRDVFGFLFPKSMIVLENEDWQRIRRISQKALNRMDLNKVIGASIEVMDSAFAHKVLGTGEDIACYKPLSLITFDTFHKVMYSMDPRAVTNDRTNRHVRLIQASDELFHAIRYRTLTRGTKWTWNLPLKKNRAVKNARNYILEVGKQVIAQRRQELQNELGPAGIKSAKTGTLLDGLLLSQDEELMTDVEVLDQIATFFFGAFETTSNTLMFALDGLAHNREAQDQLRAELKKAFPNGKADLANAKLADLDTIKYLVWTVDEAFRLNSTAWGFPRDCIKDVVVGGYEIKANTAVVIDHRSASRDPGLWHGQTNLDKFEPSRFATYPMERLHSLPFGFGPRICPGRRIAMAEMKTMLCYLVLQYEILPPSDPAKNLVLDTKLGLTCADGTGYMRFRALDGALTGEKN